MIDLQNLKNDIVLAKNEFDLSKQLSRDNAYRNLAFLLLIALILAAFFISLASNDFDFSKIWSAQFWTDFLITTGGGFLLRWAFGKWGGYVGHTNKEVVKVLNSIDAKHKEIYEMGATTLLGDYIKHNNRVRKLNAIKKQVYWKLNATFSFKKKWQQMKHCVMLAEELLETKDADRFREISNELALYNFDLDSYKIRYHAIKESSLRTGATISDKNDKRLSYNEMAELFGKKIVFTTFTTLLSILFAISNVTMNDITLATIYLFITRVTLYVLNAYSGFTTGRSAVETKKLSILNNIDNFLARFIENVRKGKEIINNG